MSRFGSEKTLSTTRSAAECITAARDALAGLEAKPCKAASDDEVCGRLGYGWRVRLLGGLLTPAAWFPVQLTVSVEDTGAARTLRVRADENFGLGSLAGIEAKVRAHCESLADQLAERLARLTNGTNPAQQEG